jgi:hypothetical protein
MKTRAALLILLLLLSSTVSKAVQPKQDTLQVWDDHIRDLKSSMAERAAGNRPFLWVDESPDMVQRLLRSEVVVTDHDPRRVPQGLIHHWVGAIFIPNVKLDQVLGVLNDYNRYSEIYKPLIKKAEVLTRDENTVKLDVLAVQKAFSVTAAVELDEEVQIERPTSNRVFITANSIRVQEIANYGLSNEHPFQEDRRPGYVWRSFVLQRIEERDGGVYVELETVALSRSIPIEFRWLIKPLTDELPRKMMTDMLDDMRSAARQEPELTAPQGLGLTGSR